MKKENNITKILDKMIKAEAKYYEYMNKKLYKKAKEKEYEFDHYYFLLKFHLENEGIEK